MQFDPVSGAPISQTTTGATYDSGTNTLTYAYTQAGTALTIEVGSGIITYDQALPAGTTIELYEDAACTTKVPTTKYIKTTVGSTIK